MFKKFFSFLSVLAIFAMLFPSTTFAADVPTTFVTNVTMTVGGQSASSFKPSAGESAQFNISYDIATYSAELSAVSGYIRIKKGNDTVYEIMQLSNVSTNLLTLGWDGKVSNNSYCGLDTVACGPGNYTFEVHIESVSGADTLIQTKTLPFEITNPITGTFSLTYPGDTFDPSSSGDNEDLSIAYNLNQVADTVVVRIFDDNDDEVKSFTANTSQKQTATLSWNGEYNGYLVDPGFYEVRLTAEKAGFTTLTDSKNVEIKYQSGNKPLIRNLDISPSSFDPDYEDLTIAFENNNDAKITVKILDHNGNTVRTYSDYTNDEYDDDDSHEITWDGKEGDGDDVDLGTYTVYIRAENNYGVVAEKTNITVNNSQGTVPSSNAHIDDITFSPSTTFEPEDDDELEIKFDIKKDLDDLLIIAQKGSDKVEIADESNLDKQSNYDEITWNGEDDDGDFVEAGTWKIFFYSTVNDSDLVAAKTIKIKYSDPQIDEFILSKKKFDNEIGEFTYALVKIDADALIDLDVLVDGDTEDEIVEGFEVEKDKWYAFEWDGGSFEYDDDLDIKLTTYNILSEDESDDKTIAVDLAEDVVASSRANITGDYIDPVISTSTGERNIYFDLDEDADVTITIHRGQSSSGTIQAELTDKEELEAGRYEITWNGRDDDGDKLSTGYYTYKIVSDKSNTDTEYGTFVVGTLGDIDGDGGSSSNSDDDDDGKISSAVISINGNIITPGGSSDEECGGFSDVSESSQYCQAIEWVKEEGIFEGYVDGTFKPYQTINRVEMLKVVMETLNVNVLADDYTNLGFSDVQVGAWYMKYIKTGQLLGIFKGDDGANTARPAGIVNRAEALKIFFETLRISTGYTAKDCAFSYGDVSDIAWFKSYACESKTRGLFTGSSLLPGKLSTRGEIADLLYDAHQSGLY